MKILNSPIMKSLLARGIKRAKKFPRPSNGSFFPLFQKELKNGWYYQVDYIFDSRMEDKSFVAVHAFKPPRVYYAKSAEYILRQEVKK